MGKTFNTGRLGNGLFVDANGNVGIGTTVPDNTYQGLTIYGSNPSVRLKGTSTGSWNWIEFVTSAGVNNFSMGVSQSTPIFAIKAGAGLDNPNFVMTSSGNVGIGTSSPNSLLNIVGNASTNGLTIKSAGNGGTFPLRVTWSGGTDGDMLNVNDNGNVQINNALSTYAKLNVKPTNNQIYGGAAFYSTDGTETFLGIGNIGSAVGFEATYGSTGSYVPMIFKTGGSERMRISSIGTIAIGTTYSNSVYKLVAKVGTDRNIAFGIQGGDCSIESFNDGVSASTPLRIYGNNISLLGGNVGVGNSSPNYKLDVDGSIKGGRVVYQWYWGSWQGNSTYWHMKTNLWGGGSPNGNSQYTMSFFKGYSYSYGGSILEGAIGFHNWSGTLYNVRYTGNIFTNVYVSSDGYVVLVIPSGSGETGVVIDWHQHFEYPTRVCQVTAAGLHGATSGKY